MYKSKAIMPFVAISLACVALAAASAPVAAQGSQNDMFRRHFWRGQAYHGVGYPAQVGELDQQEADLRAPNTETFVD